MKMNKCFIHNIAVMFISYATLLVTARYVEIIDPAVIHYVITAQYVISAPMQYLRYIIGIQSENVTNLR